MTAPPRPSPPVISNVTHHSLELQWEEALDKVQTSTGDARIKVTLQQQDKQGGWANIYNGYAKKYACSDLDPWTTYAYRLKFVNANGPSEWSAEVSETTLKEPLTGDHLHKAIIMQDLAKLEGVLESGDTQVDTPDKYGFSPLMQAAQKGYIDFIDCLVRYGADVNLQNEAGKTSLMLAAYAGKIQSAKELRHHGAKYEVKDKGGSAALHWAMDGANLDLIEWMVEDGADIEVIDLNGWTPLLRIAAVGGNKDVAKLVLRLGASINKTDKDGKSPLMIAVVNGHQQLVEVLLEKGADLTVVNDYGKTAYDMAVSMERRSVQRAVENHMKEKGIKF